MHGNDNKYRHAGKDDKGKYPVYRKEINKGQNYHHRADKKIFRAVVCKLANLKQVARDPRHYFSGLIVIVKLKGQLLKMLKKVYSHLRLHLYTYDMTVILHEISQKKAQHVKCQHDDTGNHYRSVHLVRYIIVEHLIGNDGIYHSYERYEKCCQHIKRQHNLVRLVVAYEAF